MKLNHQRGPSRKKWTGHETTLSKGPPVQHPHFSHRIGIDPVTTIIRTVSTLARGDGHVSLVATEPRYNIQNGKRDTS